MPRPLRVEYEGAIYHVLNRGDRREPIFKGDSDRELFLKTLGEACEKTGWQVHAYCLMGNHFHLVLETPQPNLVAGMKWFLGTYTARFNRRHKLTGHLFAGRYKALLIDGSSPGYLRTVCDYVHLNPVRAKLISPDEPLRGFVWSSLAAYLEAPQERPGWLCVDRLFGEMKIPKDSPAGRREFERQLESRRQSEDKQDWKPLRRGWYLGDEEFRKELIEQLQGRAAPIRFGPAQRESAQESARRLLESELKLRGLTRTSLKELPKGHPHKVAIGRVLRQSTTMTLRWIAQELEMGSWTYTAHCLAPRRAREENQGKTARKQTIAPANRPAAHSPRKRPAPTLPLKEAPLEADLPTHCL